MLLNAGRGCEGKYPVCPAEEERVGSPREPEGQAGQQLHCLDPAGRAYLSWVAVWVGPGGVEVGALPRWGAGCWGISKGRGRDGPPGAEAGISPWAHGCPPTSHPQRRPPLGVRAELPMPTPPSELHVAGSQHF